MILCRTSGIRKIKLWQVRQPHHHQIADINQTFVPIDDIKAKEQSSDGNNHHCRWSVNIHAITS